MKITQNLEDGKLTITLEGHLDTITSPQLKDEMNLEGVTELVFNFTAVDYISSAGLRLLLSAQKTMLKQGKMTLVGVQPVVKEVFDLTGFSDIFDFT